MENEPKKILNQLTVEEKIALVSGTDFMYTNPIPRFGIKSLRMSDGPHGLRVQSGRGDNGVTGSEIATAFPTASAVASSWNCENALLIGEAIGKEAHKYKINVVLGPGANIKRSPTGGRNFEYFSEDPLLSGKMAAKEIEGIQSQGVAASLKHFALNNAETFRNNGDSVCDERAMREIYLKSFEIAVKDGHPATVMSAYNKINGEYCSENRFLLRETLREEWGFKGLVMTDWGAMHDRNKSLEAGLDLEMPGDCAICRQWIYDGIKDGSLSEERLDRAALNVLNLIEEYGADRKDDSSFVDNDKLAEEVAIDSAVLLKNESLLPLDPEKDYVVLGDLFRKMRYQGAGSSMINPAKLTSPEQAFVSKGIRFAFARGYKESETATDPALLQAALKLTSKGKTVLVFAGLTDYVEMESSDRTDMALPKNQLELIDKVCAVNKNVIVVLFGGSSIELPFLSKIKSLLLMHLPGQAGGRATAKLLFGEATPSGHLAETWLKQYSLSPLSDTFGKGEIEAYRESIYVGYRYYSAHKEAVAFPFGFGLSYTEFCWRDFRVAVTGDDVQISLFVKNIGPYDGADVVQIYTSGPKTNIDKPVRELRAFTKVYLQKGQEKNVELHFSLRDLQLYDVTNKRFALEQGKYLIEASHDSLNCEFESFIEVEGESLSSALPSELKGKYLSGDIRSIEEREYFDYVGYHPPKVSKLPITLDSKLDDLQATFLGRILRKAVLGVAAKRLKKAKKLPEGPERDNQIKGALFLHSILVNNTLISMSMSAGKSMPYNFALGFRELSNGHLIKGIKRFAAKIQAPKLPKEENHE